MFKSKTILVTGASKGLGKEMAHRFEKEGARLILAARSEDKLVSCIRRFASPKKHRIIQCDVLDKVSSKKALSKVKELGNSIDVVLHCAGGGLGITTDIPTSEDLWKVFEINLGFAAEVNKIVIPMMKEKKSGKIIHISSVNGTQSISNVAYSTFKAAISGYVRMLGNNLAKDSITVAGIIPGAFYADENAMARFQKINPVDYKKFIENKIPNKEIPLASQYWPLIKFLAGREGHIMAGSLIAADAGQSTPFFIN